MNLISGISVSLEYSPFSVVASVYLDNGDTVIKIEQAEADTAANAISAVMSKLTNRILEVVK